MILPVRILCSKKACPNITPAVVLISIHSNTVEMLLMIRLKYALIPGSTNK